MFKVLVDDRERKIKPFFDKYFTKDGGNLSLGNKCNILYEMKRLHIGDYAICFNELIYVIIERKTWMDLSDSIRNVDRSANIKKLLMLREKTHCFVFYIVEGSYSQKTCGLPRKSLLAYLDHRVFCNNIHVFFTTGISDTFKRILTLVKNLSTAIHKTPNGTDEKNEMIKSDGTNKLNETIAINEPNKTSKENESNQTEQMANESHKIIADFNEKEFDKVAGFSDINANNTPYTKDTDTIILTTPIKKSGLDIKLSMLCCIDSVGEKTAKKFIDSNVNLSKLLRGNYDVGELIKFVGNNAARTNKIIKSAKIKDTHVNILDKIPQITRKSAITILENFDIATLLTIDSDNVAKERLISLKRTPSKTLGMCIVNNIQEYLVNFNSGI